MAYIQIPMNVNGRGLVREEDIKKSIDSSLNLLLSTSQYSTPSAPQFGFVFMNLRFEIFNEGEGVVYNSDATKDIHGLSGLYDKKVSGTSKNLNTFAAELKEAVNKYEKRLDNVATTMTYIREERQIYITIKGIIISTNEPYTYTSTISVWK